MLGFASKQIKVKTLLSNANEVTKFTPEALENNALQLNTNGEIQVSTKAIDDDEIAALSESIQNLTLEKRESFAQEKMILLWHFSQLLPYLSERLAQLRSMPIDNLHQYHDNSMQFQGFYQLSLNMISQLARFNELFTNLENPQKDQWSIEFKLLQRTLSSDFKRSISSAQQFIKVIAEQRKEKFTAETADIEAQFMHHGLMLREVTRSMPIKYSLGAVKVGEQRHHVQAYFQTLRATWENPEKFQFTGKLILSVLDGNTELCSKLSVFPCWDTTPLKEKCKTELDSTQNTTYHRVSELYSEYQGGTISFEIASLRAHFSKHCTHVGASQMLPFFVTLVGIAQSHHMSEITVYAPYNQSAIMYSFGFHSLSTDVHSPSLEQQRNTVENAYAMGVEVPYLNINVNRQEGNAPLLRPFCFDMHLLAITPVYATEARIKTTYAKLLSESSIHAHEESQGILPEVLQVPLKFTGALLALRNREITGKLKKPSVAIGVSSVDYKAIETNERLTDYAFSDTTASTQSQYTKMLTLSKR